MPTTNNELPIQHAWELFREGLPEVNPKTLTIFRQIFFSGAFAVVKLLEPFDGGFDDVSAIVAAYKLSIIRKELDEFKDMLKCKV